MDRVRFGVVGMGPRGQRGWLANMKLVEGLEIVAVCDSIEARRLAGAERAGLAPRDAHVSLDDLLARSDVDAVAVVVATEDQPEILVKALAAGKHVICEVPLTYALDDCWRIVLAAERSGKKVAMAEQRSYAPFTLAWKAMREEGKLGKVLYGEAQYLHGMPDDQYWVDKVTGERFGWERAKGNPNAVKTRYWNIAHPIWYNPHSLTPLLRVLDEQVVMVTCMATRRPGYHRPEIPNSDVEVALLHTDGDTILRIACGFIAPSAYPHHWMHLLGTKGEVETTRRSVTASDEGPGALIWLADQYTRTRSEIEWTFTPYQPGAARAEQSGHGGRDYYPIRDFVDSILQDRPPTIDAYRAAEVAASAIIAGQSAERGSIPLEVPDFRPGPTRPAGRAPADSVEAASR